MFPTKLFAGAVALALTTPAFAEITIQDAYARVASPTAKAGAAFMVIENSGDADRLIGAASDVAKKVELHTHKEMGEGVMRMMHVEDGFPIPAAGHHALARGGDHVMFMGLNHALAHGDVVTVTLTFEQAGDITVEIPVDLERQADHGAMKMSH
jgi:copper(I)-binding protein